MIIIPIHLEVYGNTKEMNIFLNNSGAIADFPADNNSASFEFKIKLAGRIGHNGKKDVKNRVSLKYLSNFSRTLEMQLISCEINHIQKWSARCFLIDDSMASQEPTFTITDTKCQNYCNNWNKVSKEQLTRINIIKK